MIDIGEMNRLKVVREVPFGVYLGDNEGTNVLLPKAQVPAGTRMGDRLQVFVYLDSDDYLIATMEKPKVMRGQFANLQVRDVNKVGAFLDWGMPKDLMLPYAEQLRPLKVGDWVTVCVYLDNSERLAASAKLERFVETNPSDLSVGDVAELLLYRRSDLGFNVIINNRFAGLLHQQDIFKSVRYGRMTGYIKHITPEGKIDVSLERPGYGRVDPLVKTIETYLDEHDGKCPVSDKSSPDEIKALFGVSKKAFKMAIGALLKQKAIRQTDSGIERV